MSYTSDAQNNEFERCDVLINTAKKIAFHTGAVTPFDTHFMASLLITQDAFLIPFGLISFLQSPSNVLILISTCFSFFLLRIFTKHGTFAVEELASSVFLERGICRMSSRDGSSCHVFSMQRKLDLI